MPEQSISPLRCGARPTWRWPGIISMFLVIFVIVAYKANDALINPQFWAEDANIFFKQQLAHGYPLLLRPYPAYFNVIPRAVAWVASLFALSKAPLVFNICALLVTAASISFLVSRLARIVPPILVLAAILLVPGSGEAWGSLTNVQWFAQFALAAACFVHGPVLGRAGGWARALLVLCLALTGPFSVFVAATCMGLAGAAWFARRRGLETFDGELARWYDDADPRVLGALALGAVTTLVAVWVTPPPHTGNTGSVASVLSMAFGDILPVHLFGTQFLTATAWYLVYGALLACVLFGKRLRGRTRIMVLAFCCMAFIETYAAARMTANLHPLLLFADRYFMLAKLAFWMLVWAACASMPGIPRMAALQLTVAAILLVTLNNTAFLRREPLVEKHWKIQVGELAKPGMHKLTTNPDGWTTIIETDENGNPR